MDLYARLGDELRLLFKDLFDPSKQILVRQRMDEILETAKQIGEPLLKEAEQLKEDIAKYLHQPSNKKFVDVVKKHALRLEQETREI